ncbi:MULTISPECIES: hypothetical protein [Streptomyces]|uniref:hypothetical protein n=1 Tax=Streptomyces TaxID=1883 RepID=UPI000ABFF8E6|nr:MULTISPECIES: hypothetical protein [Streptomyces]
MRRGFGALCATVALVTALAAATACEPILVPARRQAPLPEPAPPATQWIVDLVAALNTPPQCPKPTRSTMTVLDTDGRYRAMVFWLVDSLDVCYAVINHKDTAPTTIWFAAIEDLVTRTPMPADTTAGVDSYAFTAYRGRVDGIEVSGDTDRLVSPVHLHTVDLGALDLVTFAEYHYRIPPTGRPLSITLCTPTGTCRNAH